VLNRVAAVERKILVRMSVFSKKFEVEGSRDIISDDSDENVYMN